jgi:hypothetical protein
VRVGEVGGEDDRRDEGEGDEHDEADRSGASVAGPRVPGVPAAVDDLAVEADLGLAHRHRERALEAREPHGVAPLEESVQEQLLEGRG